MRPRATAGNGWSAWLAVAGLALWGVIHILGGMSLLAAGVVDGLVTLGPSVTESVPGTPGATVEGLFQFHSLNVLIGGLVVLGLSVVWWRQRRSWQLDVALATAIGLDIGLVVFMVIPGILPVEQGLIGPVLATVAVVGALRARRQSPGPSPAT